MEKSNQIIEEKSDGFFRRIQEENNSTLSQPIQSCLIWPVQKTMKYVQLLKEILDCITGESSSTKYELILGIRLNKNSKLCLDPSNDLAKQKLREAIAVMEAVPGKANDAMHLGLCFSKFKI